LCIIDGLYYVNAGGVAQLVTGSVPAGLLSAIMTSDSTFSAVSPSNALRYSITYTNVPCFLEGTKILSLVHGEENYVPIERLFPGSLVKTSKNGYKEVVFLGKRSIFNPGHSSRTGDRLYRCSREQYPELSEDLYITGCHSILVDDLTATQRDQTSALLGQVYVTDGKYRLMSSIDERTQPWTHEGEFTVWHVALENNDRFMNYGVYANGGLLVETCSIRYLSELAQMELVTSSSSNEVNPITCLGAATVKA
jgi:hypothetical protein